MTDRNANNERASERRPAEGVRIIGAEEAQKALEAGQVAGRRSDDELRYGDVPPAPSGPRPPHRFPLPDSVDPAEAVPRLPVAPLRGESPQAHRRPRPAETSPATPAQPAAGSIDEYPYPDEEAADEARWADADAEQVDLRGAGEPPAGPGWAGGAEAWSSGDEIEPTGPLPVLGADPGRAPDAAGGDASDPGPPRLRWAPGSSVEAGERGAPAAAADQPPGLHDTATYAPITLDPPPDGRSTRDDPATYDPATYDPAIYDPAIYDPATPGPTADGPSPDGGAAAPGTAGRATSWNLGERSSPWDAAGGGAAGAAEDDAWDTGATWSPAATGDNDWADDAGAGDPSWGGDDRALDDRALDDRALDDLELDDLAHEDRADGDAAPDMALPEEGLTVTGSHALPHWTEPSEGLPASLLDPERDDDADAWNALGAGGARWRTGGDDWDDEPSSAGFFADEEGQGPRLGALDTERSDRSDLYSFDEAFQQLEEERSGAHVAISVDDPEEAPLVDQTAAAPVRTRPATRTARPRPTRTGPRAPKGAPRPRGTRPPSGTQDLGSRLAVGAGLVVLLAAAYAVGPKALVVLAAAVVLLCAAEAYGVLQRCGFRPATLLGLAATGGIVLAAYWRGEAAVPLVLGLSFAATMVWYLLGIVEARPLANVAVTSMTILWIGLLGSFAALMLRVPHGKGLFLGAVVVTVASDIVAYFAGRQFGHRPLAPGISPGKTVEGLAAGAVAAIVVGLIIGHSVSPWGGLEHGLLLGIAVAIFAPIGDLFESLIKRDLDVKDSGTALAGHGGLLDRFDSILLVLPAVYYLADYLHLVR